MLMYLNLHTEENNQIKIPDVISQKEYMRWPYKMTKNAWDFYFIKV